jgi:hypothetical protein
MRTHDAAAQRLLDKWDSGVTSQDVVNYGLLAASKEFAKFALACIQHNESGCVEAIRGIHTIARRMDNFRRMKAQEWAGPNPSQIKREETPE